MPGLPPLVGKLEGAQHRIQALRRAEIARKSQIEIRLVLCRQGRFTLRHGIVILTVLRDHGNAFRLLAGALQKALTQAAAHGDQSVGPAIVPIAHCLCDPPQKFVFYGQHTVQIFRPDIQHIAAHRGFEFFPCGQCRPVHQHRAGVIAQNGIIAAGQAVQTKPRKQRPAAIVGKNAQPGVAFTADLTAAVYIGALVIFVPGALAAVAREPFPLGIVGQPAQNIHLQPIRQKALYDIIDAEIFRPEMLGDYQNSFFLHGCPCRSLKNQYLRHTILLTTPV